MFKRIRFINKRLITHSCGEEILIADNYMYCPRCKEPVIARGRTKKVPRPPRERKLHDPRLRVPRVLRREKEGEVLPRHIRARKALTRPRGIILPIKPRMPSIKKAKMPKVPSKWQNEIQQLWQQNH